MSEAMAKNRRTWLYRFFDAKGRLLYVGIAYVPSLRWQQHRHAYWWSRVDHVTADVFATRDQAIRAEARAIAEERPLFNDVRPSGSVPPPIRLTPCASWIAGRPPHTPGAPRLVCRRLPGHSGQHRSADGHEWAR